MSNGNRNSRTFRLNSFDSVSRMDSFSLYDTVINRLAELLTQASRGMLIRHGTRVEYLAPTSPRPPEGIVNGKIRSAIVARDGSAWPRPRKTNFCRISRRIDFLILTGRRC